MERKVGEVFTYDGKTYQAVESIRCDGCAFNRSVKCSTIRELLGSCDSIKRKDGINVIFKEINNMEAKINIAEILRNKPHGIKLYSPIFSDCTYCYIHDETGDICVKRQYNVMIYFNFEGLYDTAGECLLFPSKEMRDWEKFSWKTGEVLVSNDGKREVLFKTWVNDSYTKFVGFHCLIINDNEEVEYDNGTTVFNTNDFKGIEAENAVQTYINTIEERLGGKLNRETLEIEKAQPEFKDGDILYAEKDESHTDAIFILETVKEERGYYACLILHPYMVCTYSCGGIGNKTLRYATEEEKQQLFDALAKEGKAWNAEKKQIIDLKPEIELKPFDKVLVRDLESAEWRVNLFSHIGKDKEYYCVWASWIYCIPYEGNEHLLGTNKNV